MSFSTGRFEAVESETEYQPEDSFRTDVAQVFYPVFKRYFEGREFIDELESDLGSANIDYPVEIYTSVAIGYGAIVGAGVGGLIGALVAGVLLLFPGTLPTIPLADPVTQYHLLPRATQVLNAVRIPTVSFVIGLIWIPVGTLVAVGVAALYPKQQKHSRATEIDLIMPDVTAFLYSLSVGGTNQLQMIQAVAEAEDTYGEAAVEFQRIAYSMEYFGTDYQTAVENIAALTPSDQLEAFLTDMLSVIDSGGDMTQFLSSQQEMMRDEARKQQEEMLDRLEMFGELYLTLQILPLGLLIVFVIMSLGGAPQLFFLSATVYGLLPGFNVIFGLLIATIKRDEIGDGRLDPGNDIAALGEDETRLSDLGVLNYYTKGSHGSFFQGLRPYEVTYRIRQILSSPWEFFRLRPPYVLLMTGPLTIGVMGFIFVSDLVTFSISGFIERPYIHTVIWVYLPLLINLIPMSIFYEWNRRTKGRITDTLTEDLRKLANANETGQPLLEAIRITSLGQNSLLAQELERVYKKTLFGTSLSSALVEFNNRYSRPRLARNIKLIQEAQEASSNIVDVLKTAATASRYQDELIRERVQRTRLQVAVIGLTFVVSLVILMILEVFFIGNLLDATGGSSVSLSTVASINTDGMDKISLLFFHAITIQAICAGGISGFVQTDELASSFKYIIAYLLLASVSWGLFAV